MNIKAIEINFENCEDIVIPIYYVNFLYISDIIYEHSLRGNCNDNIHMRAKFIRLHIDKHFQYSKIYQHNLYDNYNAYERLKNSNDITSITLLYDDYTRKLYYTFWNEESNYSNKYQKIVNQNGNLYITIEVNDD